MYKARLSHHYLLPPSPQAKGVMDEDGFFEGELHGKHGLVPENMVEEITAPEELSQIQLLLAAQAAQSHRRGSRGMCWKTCSLS